MGCNDGGEIRSLALPLLRLPRLYAMEQRNQERPSSRWAWDSVHHQRNAVWRKNAQLTVHAETRFVATGQYQAHG